MELSIVTLGNVHPSAFETLTLHFPTLERVATTLGARADLAAERAELNGAVDAAGHDWILILREGEFVDALLAEEIPRAIESGEAWGFRIRVRVMYAGRPLRIGGGAGELRLFHRRHLLRRGELAVQGTVIRLHHSLTRQSFQSAAEHRGYLQERGVPHSMLRRTLLFLRRARTLDRNTLRYLWIEAGFDQNDATR